MGGILSGTCPWERRRVRHRIKARVKTTHFVPTEWHDQACAVNGWGQFVRVDIATETDTETETETETDTETE